MTEENVPGPERPEQPVYRSATEIALATAAIVAPIAAPYIHEGIQKITAPDEEQHVVVPPSYSKKDE